MRSAVTGRGVGSRGLGSGFRPAHAPFRHIPALVRLAALTPLTPGCGAPARGSAPARRGGHLEGEVHTTALPAIGGNHML
jgi:hypothetical protein